MIKGCIFDMDGVIVDTAEAHYQSWLELTSDWGFHFSREENEALKGVSRMKSLELILDLVGMKRTPSEKEELCELKNERYLASIKSMTSSDILPGIKEILEELRSLDIKISLGSASKNAKTILGLLGIEHYFDAMIDGNDLSKGKPDPQVFLLAAARLELDPSYCLVFEDAAKGVSAAHAAGMKVVGIGSEEALGEADLVLPSLRGKSWQWILGQIDWA